MDTYKIKELREKMGLTQEALSQKANVARSLVAQLESGKVKVTTTNTLGKLANALECKMSDLLKD